MDATTELFIVSPYIKIGEWARVKKALYYALNDRAIPVTFVTRSIYDTEQGESDEENASNNRSLAQLEEYLSFPSCQIYTAVNLHSKIYFNGQQALVTSMNLYDVSAEKNHEIGVLFGEAETKHLDKIRRNIDFIIKNSFLQLSPAQEEEAEEQSETSAADATALIEEQFTVLSKGYKWYHVRIAKGYMNKILIENVPELVVGRAYTVKAKQKWSKTPDGRPIVELLDLKDLEEDSNV